MSRPRICNAAIGFAVGIFTLPLAAAAWPFVMAWCLANEPTTTTTSNDFSVTVTEDKQER